MSGIGGPGLPDWWGYSLGRSQAQANEIERQERLWNQMQNAGPGSYVQVEQSDMAMLKQWGMMQQQQQNYEAQMFAPFGTPPPPVAAAVPLIKRSPELQREIDARSLTKPKEIPDWVWPTTAQWWLLGVFVAFYVLCMAAFYQGLP